MEFPTHIVSVAGYVFDKNDRILMIKTKDRGWDCPYHQVENGENLEEALLRGIYEESGITVQLCRLCGVYSYVGKTAAPTGLDMDFICEYADGEPQAPEVKWVPRTEALSLITAPASRYRYEKMLDFCDWTHYASYVTEPEFKVLFEKII